MPNHVHNRLTILGPDADVRAFVDLARSAPPQPLESEMERKIREAAGRFEREAPEVEPLNFAAIVPLPTEYTQRTYHEFGYNAEQQAWGVKWGAYGQKEPELSDGRATYTFDTAWGPALTWQRVASLRFPACLFLLSWGGEGPTRGRFVCRCGEDLLLLRDAYRREDYPGDVSNFADEDAYCDAYNAAERKYILTHEAFVDEWGIR